MELRTEILEVAISWNIGMISAQRIDQVNILNATYEAMHEAVAGLAVVPEFLLVDGNRFRTYPAIPNECIVKGDAKFLNIASASILAKTYRDEIMTMLDEKYPEYGWAQNKGYPTKAHKMAIQKTGPTSFHRTSFNWKLPVNLF
ncbi:UNVERIFIED_CONTAM: hypothetical protein GTU68_040687 [Idotea baltica]|nr:hypothetical protein [Idotea baltica]